MSKIKKYGAELFEQQQFGTDGIEGVKNTKLLGLKTQNCKATIIKEWHYGQMKEIAVLATDFFTM